MKKSKLKKLVDKRIRKSYIIEQLDESQGLIYNAIENSKKKDLELNASIEQLAVEVENIKNFFITEQTSNGM